MPAEEFVDDVEGVPDDAVLYRRVDWDKVGGRDRCLPGAQASLTANCFRDYPDDRAVAMGYPGPCMSVAAGNLLPAEGPSVLLAGYPAYGLAAVTAGALRQLTRASGDPCPQGVMLAPTASEPWHAVVFDLTTDKRSDGVCKAIAAAARWELPLMGA